MTSSPSPARDSTPPSGEKMPLLPMKVKPFSDPTRLQAAKNTRFSAARVGAIRVGAMLAPFGQFVGRAMRSAPSRASTRQGSG